MHAADLLSNRANLTPKREALLELETGIRYSYAALNERANRCAHWLQSCGVDYGDRVSILAHNSVVYLDLLYGCAKIGAIFTPLNWRLAVPELVYIVQDCTPTVLLVDAAFAEMGQQVQAQAGVAHFVTLTDYETALARQTAAEPSRPVALNSESTHCILYTSGTTGRPKGAMIPHRQVLWNCINTAVSWGLTEHDVSPVFTPLFHAGGLFAFMTPLFYLGGRIILTKDFDAEESLQIILDEQCTIILGVPTLFQMWQQTTVYETAVFHHVHFFISGGAPCPPPLIEKWRQEKGVVFRQGYGLTEVGTNCFSMTDAESVPKTGSVGKPIFHSQMRLVDDNGADVPVGATGELLIKGPHVTTGYWHNPEATAQSLVDGWFHTGDMARMDEDGFFTIVGRFKDMIISGGENVYAAEVEAVFREHTAVAEAALIGQPDDKWGEIGLMITVLKPGQTVSEAELQDFCRQRLARYKVPKEVIFVDALPYSPYGKVEKMKLKEKYVVGKQ
ncbi:MAG: long-chain fatty acid--CoA ligase [Ardenticatenaceae bacterium]|nr:long-chain fatty acid--CoA ligase [Ardenticatenaceae bacterium]MCB9444405.1 long-chain fatty acid--CoA ligase [Ardenticatenaceae bacterium]